jgi:hypothetical protein
MGMKFSPCMKRLGCDEGLKLFDGIFTGFVLWRSPERSLVEDPERLEWTLSSPSEFVKGELGMFTGADVG